MPISEAMPFAPSFARFRMAPIRRSAEAAGSGVLHGMPASAMETVVLSFPGSRLTMAPPPTVAIRFSMSRARKNARACLVV